MSLNYRRFVLAALVVVLQNASSYAQSPTGMAPDAPSADACDCTKRVGSCRATVTFKDGSLNVISSSRQCSLVEFRVNGDSRTSTVVNGKAAEQWLGDEITSLVVTSCSVCADSRK